MCETVADIPNQARFGKMISRQLKKKKKKSHAQQKPTHSFTLSPVMCQQHSQ